MNEQRSQFYRWLSKQIGRRDQVGEFARTALGDFRFPDSVENLEVLEHHIRTWDDPEKAAGWLKMTTQEWRTYKRERRVIEAKERAKRAEIRAAEESLGEGLTILVKRQIRIRLGVRADWGLRVSREARCEHELEELRQQHRANQTNTKYNRQS